MKLPGCSECRGTTQTCGCNPVCCPACCDCCAAAERELCSQCKVNLANDPFNGDSLCDECYYGEWV